MKILKSIKEEHGECRLTKEFERWEESVRLFCKIEGEYGRNETYFLHQFFVRVRSKDGIENNYTIEEMVEELSRIKYPKSKRTVAKYLKRLTEKGMLIKTERKESKRKTVYSFNFDKFEEEYGVITDWQLNI